jgi:uncharacterized protein (TIGR03067 family)
MRSHALWVVTAGLLLGAGPPADERPAVRDDLRGEWQLVSTHDEKHTDAGSEQIRMIVAADGRVVFRFGDRTTNRGVLVMRSGGTVRCLDENLAGGKTVLGVCARDGDDLVICFDEAGKRRPAGLTPHGTQWAERWRRVRP